MYKNYNTCIKIKSIVSYSYQVRKMHNSFNFRKSLITTAVHGITKQFGLEGTSKNNLCHSPHQVAQRSRQPGLVHFQGQGIHSFSEQPVPVSHLPLPVKDFSCKSNPNLLTFSSKPLVLVLLLTDPGKKSFYSSRIYTPGILEGCSKVSLVSSFLLAEKPHTFSDSLHRRGASSL